MPPKYTSWQNGTCSDLPRGSDLALWDCCTGGTIVYPDLPRNIGVLIVWALLLAWVFLGVALGADAFMSSIEAITAQTKVTTVTIRGEKKRFHTRVWNDTVANLTLMALGSSAPEILLSVIEIIVLSPKGAFYAGDLGPSTIIGSAAFNLMVIVAVCITALPEGETRTLKHLPVFAVTASFSIFAYIWTVIVLVLWTPNFVTVVEAFLTLAFMGILVFIAFLADKGYLSSTGAGYASRSLKVLSVAASPRLRAGSSEAKFGVPELSATEVARYLKQLELGDDDEPNAAAADTTAAAAAIGEVSAAAPVTSSDDVEGGRPAAKSALPADVPADFGGVPGGGVPGGGNGGAATGTRQGADSTSAAKGGGEAKSEADAAAAARLRAMTAEEIAAGMQAAEAASKPKTRRDYRAQALGSTFSHKAPAGGKKDRAAAAAIVKESNVTLDEVQRTTFVGFVTSVIQVTEGDDAFATLTVARHGCLDGELSVKYATREGTATANADYTHTEGTLTFGAGVAKQEIKVPILDDDEIEDDEEFAVVLSEAAMAAGGAGAAEGVKARIAGPKLHAECTVVIKDDDVLPGTLGWKESSMRCVESDGQVTLTVERRRGHNGEVSVDYNTKPREALEDVDYVGAHGTLTFAHGQMSQTITIEIVDDTAYEKDETFLCVLSNPTAGALFREDTDGRGEEDICTITIESDGGVRSKVDRVLMLLRVDKQKQKMLGDAWKEQLAEALALEEKTPKSIFFYVLMLPWKLLFGVCPPPEMWGGWALFLGSLLGIMLQVMLIGDLASQLGCEFGLPDEVTAITIVALGTSLPDLFASMQAARDDPTADNSVGNVTGSNSVNVFLGLGLPWVFASVYWAVMGPTETWRSHYPNFYAEGKSGFVVCAGSLGFSVTVFVGVALITLALILARRFLLSPSQELGGSRPIALATAAVFLLLYFTYLALAITRVFEGVEAFNSFLAESTRHPDCS